MEIDQEIINGTDVKEILQHSVPDMHIEQSDECAVCKVVDKFANYTIELIKKGNIPVIRDCFDVAGQLFQTGSKEVQNAMENVYLFSVTTFIDMTNAVSKQVKELLPPTLLNEYNRQVNSCNP